MRILIAAEGVKDGFRMVEFLAQRAKTSNDEYMVLSCVEPSQVDDFCTAIYGYDENHEVLGRRVSAAQKAVESVQAYLQDLMPKSQTVECQVEIGTPRQIIITKAKDWKADEIVLSSHSRHVLDKFLLGSISESVAYAAPCSVAIIK